MKDHEAYYGSLAPQRINSEDLFGELSPRTLISLNDISETLLLGQDRVIQKEGFVSRVFILATGYAQASFRNLLNEKTMSFLLRPGELIGFHETITRCFTLVNVRTVSPCKLTSIKREPLIELLQSDPEMCFQFVETLAAEIDDTYNSMHQALATDLS